MSIPQSPPRLGELTTDQFRQKLASLIDPRSQMDESSKSTIRHLAIDFVSSLPHVFGDDLDRLTLWERISTAISVAYARTVDADVEFFCSEVFRQIHAGTSAARTDKVTGALSNIINLPDAEKQAFITYCSSHLPVLLVHARARWEDHKQLNKKGGAK